MLKASVFLFQRHVFALQLFAFGLPCLGVLLVQQSLLVGCGVGIGVNFLVGLSQVCQFLLQVVGGAPPSPSFLLCSVECNVCETGCVDVLLVVLGGGSGGSGVAGGSGGCGRGGGCGVTGSCGVVVQESEDRLLDATVGGSNGIDLILFSFLGTSYKYNSGNNQQPVSVARIYNILGGSLLSLTGPMMKSLQQFLHHLRFRCAARVFGCCTVAGDQLQQLRQLLDVGLVVYGHLLQQAASFGVVGSQ